MTNPENRLLTDNPQWPDRAGFWRRLAAFIIDYLVIFVPLYVAVAILFSLTGGGITGKGLSLRWHLCGPTTISDGSPQVAEYEWQVCRTSVFGVTVATWAEGSKTATEPAESQSIQVMLDPDGDFRPMPLDLGFLDLVVLFVYLNLIERASGRSIGKRVMAIAVLDEDDLNRVGLPSRKSIRRQLAKFAGFLPLVAVEAVSAFLAWGSLVDTEAGEPFSDIAAVVVTVGIVAVLAVAAIWQIWIVVSIILRHDPVHDRFAGTTVRIDPVHQ